MQKIFNLLSRLLNLNKTEFLPVAVSWWLSFLIRFGVVIGFTLLTVYFAINYGIYSLAYLFIIHSLGIMLGSLLLGNLVTKFKKEYLLIGFSLFAAISILFSSFFYESKSIYFLVFTFLAVSVFVGQLKIVRMIFTEENFTPSQSHRVLPIIESAETIGIIFGGIIISIFAYSLSMQKFLYIWAISLLLLVPIILWYMSVSIKIPFNEILNSKSHLKNTDSRFKSVYKLFIALKHNKFIVLLVFVMFLQWAFFSIIEFQYTKALDAAIHPVGGVSDSGNHSYALAEKLGSIQAGIGFFALFFQLFIASRIMSFVGITGSLLVYPIVMFSTLIGMVLNYGVVTAVTTKFSQEIANILHYNAYHSSYYSVKHKFRTLVAELIEGFIRPLGAIVGTLFVLIASLTMNLFNPDLFLALVSLGLMVVMFVATLYLRDHYEVLPRHDLLTSNSLLNLSNALEVMSQSPTLEDVEFLFELLKTRSDLSVEIVDSILRFIGDYGNEDSLSELLVYLNQSKNYSLVTAVYALNSLYNKNYELLKGKPFTTYGLQDFYKNVLRTNVHFEANVSMLSFLILSYCNEGMIDQVVEILSKQDSKVVLAVVNYVYKKTNDKFVLGLISELIKTDSDPYLILEILYESDSSDLKNTITRFLDSSKFKVVLETLLFLINYNLYSDYNSKISSLNLRLLKDIKINFLYNCIMFLQSKNVESYISKINLDQFFVLESLIHRMNNKSLHKYLSRKTETEIQKIYIELSDSNDDIYFRNKLKDLQKLYSLLGANREYFIIKEYLSLSVA